MNAREFVLTPKKYGSWILIALTSVLLLSCADQSKQIVGSWKSSTAVGEGIVVDEVDTYTPDGQISLVGTIKDHDKETPFTGSGTWKLENGTLTRKLVTSTIPEMIPNGTVSVDKIISITDKKMTMQNTAGQTSVDTRVP